MPPYVAVDGPFIRPLPFLAAAPPAAPPPSRPPGASGGRSQRSEALRLLLSLLSKAIHSATQGDLDALIARSSGSDPATPDGTVTPVVWSALLDLQASLQALDLALDGLRETLGAEEVGRGH